MSTISFSVGLGNVWRFPHTAYENGGGAFVIAYLIVLFIVGKPLYYMESIIGQFTSRSCIKIWSVSPAFKGKNIFQFHYLFIHKHIYNNFINLNELIIKKNKFC